LRGVPSSARARFRSRLAPALLIVAWLAALSGCALMRLGYGQLDTYAAYTADEYFDLDSRQKQEFLDRFDRLHAWHRREQLPEYAAFLTEARNRFDRGATREDVAWLMDGVEERYRAIVRRGADDAAALLSTVTPQQIGALQARWEKDNRKFVREHHLDGTQEERRAARAKRAVARIENWTGSLADDQVNRVVALSDRSPPTERLRYDERVRRQQEFLRLLELRGKGEVFATRLRQWLLDWESGRTPQAAQQFRETRERRIDLYLAAARMLTPEQRAHLASRVQDYIGDFTRLAGR
jgi:hypothetical protein